jgi:hypothetical protein
MTDEQLLIVEKSFMEGECLHTPLLLQRPGAAEKQHRMGQERYRSATQLKQRFDELPKQMKVCEGDGPR